MTYIYVIKLRLKIKYTESDSKIASLIEERYKNQFMNRFFHNKYSIEKIIKNFFGILVKKIKTELLLNT